MRVFACRMVPAGRFRTVIATLVSGRRHGERLRLLDSSRRTQRGDRRRISRCGVVLPGTPATTSDRAVRHDTAVWRGHDRRTVRGADGQVDQQERSTGRIAKARSLRDAIRRCAAHAERERRANGAGGVRHRSDARTQRRLVPARRRRRKKILRRARLRLRLRRVDSLGVRAFCSWAEAAAGFIARPARIAGDVALSAADLVGLDGRLPRAPACDADCRRRVSCSSGWD